MLMLALRHSYDLFSELSVCSAEPATIINPSLNLRASAQII